MSDTRSMRFDLIAFDWDGTLFDSTAIITRCIQAAVVDLGGTRPTDGAASYVIGMGLMEALAHAAPDVPRSRYAELGERYRHHYFKQQDSISLFDGVLDMLVKLKDRGHALAVATGKSRRGLNEALQAVELQGLFAASRTADETAGKPHPMMLHELMAEMNTVPERTLMIGDTTHDLQMAINAGTSGLAVAYGAHSVDMLDSLKPLARLHSIGELSDWLASHA